MSRLFAAALTGLALLLGGNARAELPYRGTSVSYRSVVAARSLAPGAELSYNPYVAMTTAMRLAWWFDQRFYVAGAVDISRELTDSDWTTARGELVVGDSAITGGVADLWTIPTIDVDLASELELVLPTSKAAWGETLVLGTAASLTASRRFSWLEGFNLSYTFKPGKNFHRYTTAQYQGPTVLDCSASTGGCGRFYNTGSRNVSWSLSHDLSASLGVLDWLSFSASLGTITGFLYDRAEMPEVSTQLADPVGARFLNYYRIAATLRPTSALAVALGASTANPQLAPDGRYYAPVFNRYTNLFVDVRLDLANLMVELREL